MAAVALRGSLKATLLGGLSALTGGARPFAASCLRAGGLRGQSARKAADKMK